MNLEIDAYRLTEIINGKVIIVIRRMLLVVIETGRFLLTIKMHLKMKLFAELIKIAIQTYHGFLIAIDYFNNICCTSRINCLI